MARAGDKLGRHPTQSPEKDGKGKQDLNHLITASASKAGKKITRRQRQPRASCGPNFSVVRCSVCARIATLRLICALARAAILTKLSWVSTPIKSGMCVHVRFPLKPGTCYFVRARRQRNLETITCSSLLYLPHETHETHGLHEPHGLHGTSPTGPTGHISRASSPDPDWTIPACCGIFHFTNPNWRNSDLEPLYPIEWLIPDQGARSREKLGEVRSHCPS